MHLQFVAMVFKLLDQNIILKLMKRRK